MSVVEDEASRHKNTHIDPTPRPQTQSVPRLEPTFGIDAIWPVTTTDNSSSDQDDTQALSNQDGIEWHTADEELPGSVEEISFNHQDAYSESDGECMYLTYAFRSYPSLILY